MIVNKVFIPVHKYDLKFACICIASINYWYPDLQILLIKDYSNGDFSIDFLLNKFHLKLFETDKKFFGWGYAKLEPLFLKDENGFLVLDSDTVLAGPILSLIQSTNADFIVDSEVQHQDRFNEIYYNLNKIGNVENNFVYPGYSFNSGQWFGSFNKINRSDFEKYINFGTPPHSKFPSIIFNGDQSVLNFVLHYKEQLGTVKISRIKLMIWPENGNADFIDLNKITTKCSDYKFVIHWAGIKHKSLNSFPRADILLFFNSYFFSLYNIVDKIKIKLYFFYIDFIKSVKLIKEKIESYRN